MWAVGRILHIPADILDFITMTLFGRFKARLRHDEVLPIVPPVEVNPFFIDYAGVCKAFAQSATKVGWMLSYPPAVRAPFRHAVFADTRFGGYSQKPGTASILPGRPARLFGCNSRRAQPSAVGVALRQHIAPQVRGVR